MTDCTQPFILADARWVGSHGIGRYSSEVISRLVNKYTLCTGPKTLSIRNLFWQPYQLSKHSSCRIFFTPGFNAPIYSSMPFTFTLHDLIHLKTHTKSSYPIKLYYNVIIKPALAKAYKVFTVSESSKSDIIHWSGIDEQKIIVTKAGASAVFCKDGSIFTPGYPYLLHVGNATKPHKNMENLLRAFANAKIDPGIKLIFTGKLTFDMHRLAQKLGLVRRIIVQPNLSETNLAEYYRGALGLVYPSTHEGFGLPVIEAMASGIPVLTSNTSSLPEIAGEAAILTNPYCSDTMADQLQKLIEDSKLRNKLIKAGLNQSLQYSWDQTATIIQNELNQITSSS